MNYSPYGAKMQISTKKMEFTMNQNKYSQAIERVKTPLELKEKTRRLLNKETKKRKNIRIIGSIGALAAAFVLVTGVGVWMLVSSGINVPGIKSPGADSPGSDAPMDIELNFVSVGADTPPIRLALNYPLRQQRPLNELPGALPTSAPDGFSGPEGAITEYFSEPKSEPAVIVGEAVYRTKTGNQLTVTFTDSAMLYMPIEIGDSHIDDVPVGVGYDKSGDLHHAAFEKNGLTYLLTAEGLDRQDFTRVLIHFVSEK